MRPSDVAVRTVDVDIPATCGELLQGVDPDLGPLLVSLPTARTGRTRVTLLREGPVTVTPPRERAELALRTALERVEWTGGAEVLLEEAVPVGRGWGSSTIDVAGVILGVAHAAGAELGADELLRRMTDVEPSDGSPFTGLCAIDHVGGTLMRRLGRAPGCGVVVVDAGGSVDTVALHDAHGAGAALEPGTLRRLRAAVGARDLAEIGRIATLSATANDARLHKPPLAALLAAAAGLEAAGVVVAHSGSLAALLLDGPDAGRAAVARLAAEGLEARWWPVADRGARVRVVGDAGSAAPSA